MFNGLFIINNWCLNTASKEITSKYYTYKILFPQIFLDYQFFQFPWNIIQYRFLICMVEAHLLTLSLSHHFKCCSTISFQLKINILSILKHYIYSYSIKTHFIPVHLLPYYVVGYPYTDFIHCLLCHHLLYLNDF